MAIKFKIFDIRKIPSGDPARIGKYDHLVMYELDPMKRYIVKIPEEEFSEERMISAIREDMTERAKFTGKEFEVPDI